METVKGTVFNIQRFSVHDGPGIRTVVFLKGCPLRCRWCANPESQERKKELAWTKSKCIGCKSCENCDLSHVDIICPTKAKHFIGEEKTVEEVLSKVDRDEMFYSNLDGGLTVSGGEPLMQPEFTFALLSEARRLGINTAIETTGYAAYPVFQKIAGQLDYLLMDIKTYDKDLHKTHTGVSNEIILENFKRIREEFPNLQMQIRTPVIPGINDSEEELQKIHDFLRPYDKIKYELLKYHRLGESKYESLGRDYPMGEVSLSDERFQLLRKRYEFDKINNLEITGPYEGI